MLITELNESIERIEGRYGIELKYRVPLGSRFNPTISQADLVSLVAAIESESTFAGRTHAVRRLTRLGFGVSFLEGGPRPVDAGRPSRFAKATASKRGAVSKTRRVAARR
jgi:hypothetical protein